MARYSFFSILGPDKGKTFELEAGVTFIGRRDTPGSDEPAGSLRWILTDPAVSRTHARIDWDGQGAPILIHLSSTNATLLDGRIVTGQSIEDGPVLSSGSRLRMGQTTFEMQEAEEIVEEIAEEVELAEGRWYLQQRGGDSAEFYLPDESEYRLDGLNFNCAGTGVQVTLREETTEAYLLRLVDGQYWTTSLKPECWVTLKNRDIVRTEQRKLELLERQA